MKWEPDALAKVRELETNCSEFVYAASEYIAEQRQHAKVTVAAVDTVLAFVEANKE